MEILCRRCHGAAHRLDNDPEIRSIVCITCGERTYAPGQPYAIKTEDRAERQYCTNCFSDKRLNGYKICVRCYRANQRAHQTARRNRMTLNQGGVS
jgi:hypothetical protein